MKGCKNRENKLLLREFGSCRFCRNDTWVKTFKDNTAENKIAAFEFWNRCAKRNLVLVKEALAVNFITFVPWGSIPLAMPLNFTWQRAD